MLDGPIRQYSFECSVLEVDVLYLRQEVGLHIGQLFDSLGKDFLNVPPSDGKHGVCLLTVRVVVSGVIRHMDAALVHGDHGLDDLLLHIGSLPAVERPHGDTQVEGSALFLEGTW
jgi:hypothetical protein